MKKTFSLVLAAVLMLALCAPVFADSGIGINDLDDNGSTTAATLVKYSIDQGFTVTIPAEISVNPKTETPSEVTATDVLLPLGKELKVTVASENGWKLVEQSDTNQKLSYYLSKTQGGSNPLVNDGIVLTCDYDQAEVTLYHKITDSVQNAGDYRDTLTFTVAVVDVN